MRNWFTYSLILFFGLVSLTAYGTTFTVNSYDASTAYLLQSNTNQKIMYIRVQNPNGGGQANATITSLSFTPDNVDDADVSSAKLYYTNDCEEGDCNFILIEEKDFGTIPPHFHIEFNFSWKHDKVGEYILKYVVNSINDSNIENNIESDWVIVKKEGPDIP